MHTHTSHVTHLEREPETTAQNGEKSRSTVLPITIVVASIQSCIGLKHHAFNSSPPAARTLAVNQQQTETVRDRVWQMYVCARMAEKSFPEKIISSRCGKYPIMFSAHPIYIFAALVRASRIMSIKIMSIFKRMPFLCRPSSARPSSRVSARSSSSARPRTTRAPTSGAHRALHPLTAVADWLLVCCVAECCIVF